MAPTISTSTTFMKPSTIECSIDKSGLKPLLPLNHKETIGATSTDRITS
jgi:hypothetical protein